jgi:gamma-glutamylcyclotransferase
LRTGHRVFCYGSNLSIARIEERVGPVVVVTTGKIGGHSLRFHKAGRDGSGKTDAFATGGAHDVVYGVIYEIDSEAKRKLDRFEGLGVDYVEKEVCVATAARDLPATIYCAHPSRIDPSLSPFDWYLRLVIDGARRHGLPRSYIDRIAAYPSCIDPDPARSERALQLLTKL